MVAALTSRLRRGELTLAAKVLLLQLVVVAVLLTAVGVLSIRQSNADFAEERGSQMRSVAEYVADLSPVRDPLEALTADPADAADSADSADPAYPADPEEIARDLTPYVARGVRLSNADDVMVVGLDGTVLAATDPSRVGRRAALGTATPSRDGSGAATSRSTASARWQPTPR